MTKLKIIPLAERDDAHNDARKHYWKAHLEQAIAVNSNPITMQLLGWLAKRDSRDISVLLDDLWNELIVTETAMEAEKDAALK